MLRLWARAARCALRVLGGLLGGVLGHLVLSGHARAADLPEDRA
jgi:hypothetical protein